MKIAPILAFCALTASAQSLQIKSMSVGPDQTLTYPAGPANPPYLVDLPDEHPCGSPSLPDCNSPREENYVSDYSTFLTGMLCFPPR